MENKLNQKIQDRNGKILGSYDLNPDIFGRIMNTKLLHEVIQYQQNQRRQATYGTQNRSEVSYGGRKLRQQKGTGRARIGCAGAPHHRGGGVAFGPDGRLYNQKISKKKRKIALEMVLAHKKTNNFLHVLESFDLPSTPKTKNICELLKNLGIQNAVFVDDAKNLVLSRSVKNLVNVNFIASEAINPLSLLKRKHVVMTKNTLQHIEKKLSKEKK